MDVDHLIERHRLRLVEHKRFLDEEGPGSSRLGSVEQPPSISRAANTSDRSASSRNKEGSREAHITAALARAMDAAERTDGTDGLRQRADVGTLHDPITLGDGGVPSSTAMFFGYAGQQEQELVEDRLLAQHLDAAGKYYVKGPPDSMYQRSVWWLSNREKQIKEQETNMKAAALAECTFRPNTMPETAAGAKPPSRSRTPNHSAQQPPTQRGGVQRSLSPNIDAAALSHHLIRQQHARQMREEAQRRVAGPDISKWAPRQTVPKEFDLGKRNRPIPSLRQPVGMHERTQHMNAAGSAAECTPKTHRINADDDEFEPEPKRSSAGRSVPDTPELDTPASRRDEQQHQEAVVEELRRRMEILERDNSSLRRQLQEQHATLQSRNRELEIAKNTVRRLTVQGAQ